jgi:photosystem II stability/assembly factor-like uncharacterized protein
MAHSKSDANRKTAVGVGTVDGGLLLVSDIERKKWKRIGPFLKGESVNCLKYEPKTKNLFAATHTNGVFVSKDLGKTWKPTNSGLHVKKTWTIESDHERARSLYVGTQYGHLFQSKDSGASWEEVSGLFTAPKRNEWGVDWGFRTVGLCIHTIRMDPKKSNRFYIVSSGAGPYRTDDGGKNWVLLNKGIQESCPVGSADIGGQHNDPAQNLANHLEQVHRCTHKLAVSARNPEVLYQQNHCGVYRSSDSGESWVDISPGDQVRHGFPIALVEGNGSGESVFTIPMIPTESCKKHNSCIKGQVTVYRTQNGGKDWEKLTNGIKKKNHNCILRDAMGTDQLDPAGIYFGTTTGEVYGSADLGENWSLMLEDAGRVQGISAFSF